MSTYFAPPENTSLTEGTAVREEPQLDPQCFFPGRGLG